MSIHTNYIDYLQTLRRLLAGLPEDLSARAIAECQQKFADGMVAGRTEAEIAATLDAPEKIADDLRKEATLRFMPPTKNTVHYVRWFCSALGLMLVNFFLLIPAAFYAAMMFALYIGSIVVWVIGIAVTSSSLAGVTELVVDGPIRHVIMQKYVDDDSDSSHGRLNLQINADGIRLTPESGPHDDDVGHGTVVIGGGRMDVDSRETGTLRGLGLILGGIALVLFSMVMTRLTWIGLRRWFRMNLNVLRNK
jgi:uncharacterized membrane protein